MSDKDPLTLQTSSVSIHRPQNLAQNNLDPHSYTFHPWTCIPQTEMLTPDTSIFFATGPITSNPKFTPSAFITHAANVMIEQAEAELTSCWKDAARRFGPTAAGATLQDFVINNTKCLDFDPYLRDPQENVQVLFKSKESVRQRLNMHKNSWMFHLQLPKPGQGTVLEEWEQLHFTS
ncbi:hypothetical protein ABKN59_004524 [Abortiporus biennis]